MHTVSIHKISGSNVDVIYRSYGSSFDLLFHHAIEIINSEGRKTNTQLHVNTVPKTFIGSSEKIYNVHSMKLAHSNSALMCQDNLMFNIVIDDPKDKDLITASKLEWMKSGFHAGI